MKDIAVRFLTEGEEKQHHVRSIYAENVHSVFQTVEFNEIVAEVFGTQLDFLVGERRGEVIGVCPIHVLRENWLRSTIHTSPRMYDVPYGGWVLKDRKLEQEFAASVPSRFKENLLYWSIPAVDGSEWSAGRGVTRFSTLVVDLNMSTQQIFVQSIDGKRRNMIRKAEREGVSVFEGTPEHIHSFYEDLLRPTNAHAGLPIHPKAFYVKVVNRLSRTGSLKLFLAQKGERILAGVLVVLNSWFAHYWIGAKADNVENLGQGELLQWHAIQYAKRYGSRYYDLCGYEPERLPRIAEFKADFSKQVVPFYLLAKRGIGYRIAYRLVK